VLTLGPWYGHLYHHLDYVAMHNQIQEQYVGFEVPAFYRKLGKLPPGSTPIIEAPFTVGAPTNPFAFYAQTHHQPEKMGMIHDLCMSGPPDGEVPPRDPRFRFRNFVPLDDPAAARLSGARYIVLQLDYWRGEPFADAPRCLEALTRIYGAPVERDSRVAVFDLGR
jgi:hypothetical protein